MGGHNSYTFIVNTSQLSYTPFQFSGESNSIKFLNEKFGTFSQKSPRIFFLKYRHTKCQHRSMWLYPCPAQNSVYQASHRSAFLIGCVNFCSPCMFVHYRACPCLWFSVRLSKHKTNIYTLYWFKKIYVVSWMHGHMRAIWGNVEDRWILQVTFIKNGLYLWKFNQC